MKQTRKMPHIRSITLYGSILLLSACGGDSNNASPLQSQLVERSCIDSNDNNRCEQAELESFKKAQSENNEKTADIKSIQSNQSAANTQTLPTTRLVETVNSLSGEQTLVLKAPSTSTQTDALTTLLWHEIHFNPLVKTTQEAKDYLTKKLGINWPQDNTMPAPYEQQEKTARVHITRAQLENPVDVAITATAESMIQNRTLDAAADFSLVQKQKLPLATLGHYQSQGEIFASHFNNDRKEIYLAHADRKIELLSISNEGQLSKSKVYNISPGTEAAANTPVAASSLIATNNLSSQRIDAFASATTATPAPAPAPAPTPVPTQPTTPGTGSGTPAQEPRDLSPAGEIQAMYFSSDNRTGLLLTYDAAQTQSASRACNSNVLTHGVFKFDHYLTANNKTPVTSACSQQSLTRINVSADGSSALAWDQIAKRLYTINTSTMREASNYYLKLNSSLLKMKLNPAADFAFIAEEEGRKSYIVRISDMQVMTDFSFAGNQVQDIQWLADGNQLFIASNNEWQLWDTRLAHNPLRTNNGSISGSGTLTINDDASLVARVNNKQLTVYRVSNNEEVATYPNIDSVEWNGNQIFAKNGNEVKILTIQSPVTNPIQAAKALLTDSYIGANNASLSSTENQLVLPKNVAELSQSELEEFKSLTIAWNASAGLDNGLSLNENDIGKITQTNSIQQGILTATINGFFRGDAIRWTKEFNLTIPALP